MNASSPSHSIRRWSEADIEQIRRVTWKTWIASYLSFIPEEDLKTYFDAQYSSQAMEKLFRDPNIDGFVAELNGSVHGFVRTKTSSEENRFYVSSLYLLPEFHGLGLGKKMMLAAEALGREKGFEAVWLGVMVQNREALEWYKMLGFEFVEELPFTMGKTTVNHLIGSKKIV